MSEKVKEIEEKQEDKVDPEEAKEDEPEPEKKSPFSCCFPSKKKDKEEDEEKPLQE